jgi:hypothetical protein
MGLRDYFSRIFVKKFQKLDSSRAEAEFIIRDLTARALSKQRYLDGLCSPEMSRTIVLELEDDRLSVENLARKHGIYENGAYKTYLSVHEETFKKALEWD